jgi:hypothetical protein
MESNESLREICYTFMVLGWKRRLQKLPGNVYKARELLVPGKEQIRWFP